MSFYSLFSLYFSVGYLDFSVFSLCAQRGRMVLLRGEFDKLPGLPYGFIILQGSLFQTKYITGSPFQFFLLLLSKTRCLVLKDPSWVFSASGNFSRKAYHYDTYAAKVEFIIKGKVYFPKNESEPYSSQTV